MFPESINNQAESTDRAASNVRSRRLFRWLIVVLVVVIVLPAGTIAFRCYYRVEIMNRLEERRGTSLIMAKEVPAWIQSWLGDWSRGFDRVKVARLHQASPGDLRDLSHLDVEHLELIETSVSAECAASLSRMTSLKEVYIQGLNWEPGSHQPYPRVTNEALEALAGLPELKVVWLYCVSTPDGGMERLSHSESLEVLALMGDVCEADQLRDLQSLHSLRRLELTGLNVTDADCAAVRELTQLERLRLEWVSVTDRGFQQLRTLPNLHALMVDSRVPMTGASLAEFESLGHLRSVILWGNHISPECLRALKAAKNLEYLNLRGTKLSPEILQELKAALPACRIEH